MNSLIPLLALGFDFGELVPYLATAGGGVGVAAFLPKILEYFNGKKKPDDGTKPDNKPDISAILDIIKDRVGGDKPTPKPDNGGNSIADILQIGGLKANADALKKLLEAVSAQGWPTSLTLDATFASGDPIHLEFNRKKPTPAPKDGAAA